MGKSQADKSAHGPIWTIPERPGREPALSRASIVRAAIEIADTEGLHGLYMRRIAAKLGVGTMSLYYHIPSKDDLLELIVDTVVGESDFNDKLTGDWRTDLSLFAHNTREILLRHPWAPPLMTRPPLGPNALRVMESVLSALTSLGLSIHLMAGIAGTLDAYIRGFVLDEVAEREMLRKGGLTEEQWRDSVTPYLQGIMESGKYPLFMKIVVEAEEHDSDTLFDLGLECILDGIAAMSGGKNAPSSRQ